MNPLYQLRDSDNLEYGLLATNCPEEKVKELWGKYYRDDFEENDKRPLDEDFADDVSCDGFAEYLIELGYEAERVFAEDVTPFN